MQRNGDPNIESVTGSGRLLYRVTGAEHLPSAREGKANTVEVIKIAPFADIFVYLHLIKRDALQPKFPFLKIVNRFWSSIT
jgi:hypothetical protein